MFKITLLRKFFRSLDGPFYARPMNGRDWVPPVIDGIPVPLHIAEHNSASTSGVVSANAHHDGRREPT